MYVYVIMSYLYNNENFGNYCLFIVCIVFKIFEQKPEII